MLVRGSPLGAPGLPQSPASPCMGSHTSPRGAKRATTSNSKPVGNATTRWIRTPAVSDRARTKHRATGPPTMCSGRAHSDRWPCEEDDGKSVTAPFFITVAEDVSLVSVPGRPSPRLPRGTTRGQPAHRGAVAEPAPVLRGAPQPADTARHGESDAPNQGGDDCHRDQKHDHQ